MRIVGVDFTSAPRKAKPIVAAEGWYSDSGLRITAIERLAGFQQFEALLQRPGPWIGGFDFPFGLPREAVLDLKWPKTWRELTMHCASIGKQNFKKQLDDYRQTRPWGNRYATRRGDSASGAHPAVKLVNPPVGLMFFEGAQRLAAADVTVPYLHDGDPLRVALEAYPGLLIRRHLGISAPYKNDQRRKQTGTHKAIRRRILNAIATGKPHGIRVELTDGLEKEAIEDGTGDSLDAVICALQASWGQKQGNPRFGIPPDTDPLEGWIVTAQ